MALAPDKIPFPRSLRERVEELFAPSSDEGVSNPLSTRDIVAYLAKSKDTDSSPLATIRRRAAKENRRPDLSPGDHAVLAWISEAFTEWEDTYALERPLQDQLKRLQPLAVAVALSDESFLTPGAHPLHQLLDAIQNGAVGWQTRLDRAGQMLEQRVERAVEKALDWFDNDRLDISTITRELVSANDRDVARAQRMVQRLEETEAARLKTMTAKREAAEIINEGLDEYKLPSAIGEFIKGAWYDSAQLVLVKFGEDSKEWEQMSRATLHLMQSVQSSSDSTDADRDRQAQLLRHLPGQLRRWLISLEHDSDATDGAIGLVEYAHLRIQHGQVLDLVTIPPLPVEGANTDAPDTDLDEFRNGDWYQFEDEEGELRAQLVLQLERGHHLLFANFVGLKALDLSRLAFSQRVADGFAAFLPDRESFSLSLAAAAGIDSNDKYQKFLDPDYRSPAEMEAQQQAEAAELAAQQASTPDLSTPDLDDEDRTPTITPVGATEPGQDAEEELEFELDPELLADTTPSLAQSGVASTQGFSDSTPDIPIDTDQPGAFASPMELDPIDSGAADSTPQTTVTGNTPDLQTHPIAASAPPAPPDPPGAVAPQPADYDPVLAPPEGAELAPGVMPAPPAAVTPPTSAPADAAASNATTNNDSFAPAPQSPTPQSGFAQPAPAPPDNPQAPPSSPAPTTTAVNTPAPPPMEPSPPVVPPAQLEPTPTEPPTQFAPQAPTEPQVEPSAASMYEPSAAPMYEPSAAPMHEPSASSGYEPLSPPVNEPPAPTANEPIAPAINAPLAPTEAPATPAEPPEPTGSPLGIVSADSREIEVPMGAWLGFHDGETPIMAKLAVFDPRRDNYIFVNRKGIAMRELSRAELLELMDKGLVDILETRCYFRDEVERAREEDL